MTHREVPPPDIPWPPPAASLDTPCSGTEKPGAKAPARLLFFLHLAAWESDE